MNRLVTGALWLEPSRRLRRAEEVQRMRDANALLAKWGPIRAVPALVALGLSEAEVARIVRPGDNGAARGYLDTEIEAASADVVSLPNGDR